MTSPIDAAFIGFPGGQGDPNMAPSPHLATVAPKTAAAADAAAADLQSTDTTNADRIGAVATDTPAGQSGGTEMATLIPGLLGTVAGSVGGALGAAMSAMQQLPSTMMGAVGPAVSALSAAGRSTDTAPPIADTAVTDPAGYDPGVSAGGDPGTAGATTPAAGPLPTAVLPVTGASPTAPVAPPGATPGAAQTPPTGAGMTPMPMGMPMGGAGGATGAGAPESRSKKLQPPRTPHTEPVAGKTPEERIAVAAKPRNEGPVVRRVTIPEAKE